MNKIEIFIHLRAHGPERVPEGGAQEAVHLPPSTTHGGCELVIHVLYLPSGASRVHKRHAICIFTELSEDTAISQQNNIIH
jgi:hypothetical protein